MSLIEQPDFLHLRLTNDAPTSNDCITIRTIISAIDNVILHTDEAVAIAERKLKRLHANRAVLIKQRASYATLASRLRSMPIEILGEIFLFATVDSLSFRLAVSHVCRRWRNAAIGTSELWSTLDGRFPKSEKALQEYIQTCANRALSRPLMLNYLEESVLSYDAASVVAKAVGNRRWKHLSWISNRFEASNVKSFAPLVKMLASTSNDTLEKLTLVSVRHNDIPSFHLRANLSQLRGLYITMSQSASVPGVPWSQLTRLILYCKQVDEEALFITLRQCLNLVECTIQMYEFLSSEPNAVDGSIHLAKLRRLQLGSKVAFVVKITSLLETPALEDLLLDCQDDFNQQNVPWSLHKYLLNSAPTLRRLWISGFLGPEIGGIIVQLKLLEELALVAKIAHLDNRLLHQLQVQRGPPSNPGPSHIPLPSLRALQVICRFNTNVIQAFMDTITSRWWPRDQDFIMQSMGLTCLRHATLQEKYPSTKYLRLGDVNRLRQEGLQVTVFDLPGPTPEKTEFPGFRYSSER